MKRVLIKLTREIEKDQIILQIQAKLQVTQERIDSKGHLMRSIQER